MQSTEQFLKYCLTARSCDGEQESGHDELGWQPRDLVAASGVAISTLFAFEVTRENAGLANLNNKALVETFEWAGLQFILLDSHGRRGLRLLAG